MVSISSGSSVGFFVGAVPSSDNDDELYDEADISDDDFSEFDIEDDEERPAKKVKRINSLKLTFIKHK